MEENNPLQLNEEIKPIEGYEDLYSITSFGRVWSHEKVRRIGNSFKVFKAKFLKPGLDRGGYLTVILYKEYKKRSYKAHRLVAQEFISNPLNLPQVNHENCNKQDNYVDNLKWCTHQENHNHAVINNLKHKKFTTFYGVFFNKSFKNKNKPWQVQTRINKKQICIGYFKTEIEAVRVYNDFVIENKLNRPLNKIEGG